MVGLSRNVNARSFLLFIMLIISCEETLFLSVTSVKILEIQTRAALTENQCVKTNYHE